MAPAHPWTRSKSKLRFSKAIRTHVFPELKVLEIIKVAANKYTLSLLVYDSVFWDKMDKFDCKLHGAVMENPQWFRNDEFMLQKSVNGGVVNVKLTNCKVPDFAFGREAKGRFNRDIIQFDGDLRVTCTVQSKIYMKSYLGGVIYEAIDIEWS